MKRSRQIPRASGLQHSTSPAVRSPLSTNSLCAITWNGSSGRRPHRAPSCHRMLSPALAPSIGRPTGYWWAGNWIRRQPSLESSYSAAERAVVRDQLEGLVSQMVERGIQFDEAVGEFEKRFIKRVLDHTNGNQSRAAEVLG